MSAGAPTASIQQQVDHLIDTRGGKELLSPPYLDRATLIADFPGAAIYRASCISASHMIVTRAGRVIVNTGMGFETPHIKRLFDTVHPGPTPYIITTQAHVDHVGGVGLLREPGTVYVAQANNPACQYDDTRIREFRASTAQIWFDLGPKIQALLAENPGVPITQDVPTPDLTFDDSLRLKVGDAQLHLLSAPGGETIDSIIVWLPEHGTALISNLLGPIFPHFPNFNTLRGDKYRYFENYLTSIRRLRELQLDLLITGRGEPVAGRELIDACLGRLHDAVDHVHRETLAGINAGTDINTLMREIRLPPELRVGQGYGKVSWGVRTIWESYVGWFRLQSSTELYPVDAREALVELVDMIGADAVVGRAEAKLGAGEPVMAIHLAEAVLARDASHAGARALMVAAHEALLADGGDESFWESGWLRDQAARYRAGS